MDNRLIDGIARVAHDLLNGPARGGTLNVCGATNTGDAARAVEGKPTFGYYVGGAVPATVVKTCTPDVIAQFIRDNYRILIDHDLLTYLGVWQSPDSDDGGKVYIDVVECFEPEWEAQLIAESRGEIAYWDIANNRSVTL